MAPGDLGRVIGRQGRTAAALRTLVAVAAEHAGVKAQLEFRDAAAGVALTWRAAERAGGRRSDPRRPDRPPARTARRGGEQAGDRFPRRAVRAGRGAAAAKAGQTPATRARSTTCASTRDGRSSGSRGSRRSRRPSSLRGSSCGFAARIARRCRPGSSITTDLVGCRVETVGGQRGRNGSRVEGPRGMSLLVVKGEGRGARSARRGDLPGDRPGGAADGHRSAGGIAGVERAAATPPDAREGRRRSSDAGGRRTAGRAAIVMRVDIVTIFPAWCRRRAGRDRGARASSAG